MTEPQTRRTGASGGKTVRTSVDSFLDSLRVKTNPNTPRAYNGVLDRVAAPVRLGT
ncbi:hypothetical protein V5P93_003464 [Actinokineospora auranticolor]|uniref:hypothetical protein n=1 Tax=Actinokineospora auranticolor TaxID=155976 RepID=UPI0015E32B2D|nr:hypothetical protein [Actinokineospora auranticolor]